MTEPHEVSTRNIFPGCIRPAALTAPVGVGSAPISLATITRSSVMTYRPGRSPLRSSIAPMIVPSVNDRLAGPSHGSVRHRW
jgi:hypothetical protein